mmetsp:Transcript_15601/g.29502  ORF Transcript_15601/g.29502 Transcript_15601/m.29502 type:complete len:84 (+) Transcript_15601:797-1048(+)
MTTAAAAAPAPTTMPSGYKTPSQHVVTQVCRHLVPASFHGARRGSLAGAFFCRKPTIKATLTAAMPTREHYGRRGVILQTDWT